MVSAGGAMRRLAGAAVHRAGPPGRAPQLRAPSARAASAGSAASESAAGTRLRIPFKAVVADGWTPYTGRVTRCTDFGVFVDFGCERPGLLPARGSQPASPEALKSLRSGHEVTVYVTSRQRDTGKINLSLERRQFPRLRWDSVVADGRTPYGGTIANVTPLGVFVDIGTEMQGLVPTSAVESDGSTLPDIGDEATVFVYEKRRSSGRLICSLRPSPIPRRAWTDFKADGQTPYRGVVLFVDPAAGAAIDIGCDTTTLLPLRDSLGDAPRARAVHIEDSAAVAQLQAGDEITVYIMQVSQHTGKVTVSLNKQAEPLITWDEVVADGQTPWPGIVTGKTEFGAFVDFGCAYAGMLPVREFENEASWDALQVGHRVVAYAHHKLKHTGKINMSLQRSPKPRELWDAIVCDGQTPYAGHVSSTSWYGVFVDIGCECQGIMPIPSSPPEMRPRLEALKVGDAVTAYVVSKRKETWKLTLSLDRRESPLRSSDALAADGQTAYTGTVLAQTDLGAWVDIGCERPGLLPRQYHALPTTCLEKLDAIQVGEDVQVYVYLRNPANGRLILALQPSALARLRLGEVLGAQQRQHTGCVYRVKHDWAFLDFGCEASGMLARAGSGAWPTVGQTLPVLPVALDEEAGCVVLERARPLPPPFPRPGVQL